MDPINFTALSDVEIWQAFHDMDAPRYKGTPLNQLLRAIANSDPHWCCTAMRKTSQRIVLLDGTQMRIHYCPRCGREL